MKITPITYQKKHNINFGTRVNISTEQLKKIYKECPVGQIQNLQRAFERIQNDGNNNLEMVYEESKGKYGYPTSKYSTIKFNLLHSKYYKYNNSQWHRPISGEISELPDLIIENSYNTQSIENGINNSIKKNLIKKRKEKDNEILTEEMALRTRVNTHLEKPHIKIPDIPFETRETLEWQNDFKFQAKMAERQYQEELKFREKYRTEERTINIARVSNHIDIEVAGMQELFTFARERSQTIYNAIQRIHENSPEGLKVSFYHGDIINDKEEVGLKFTLNNKVSKIFTKSLDSFEENFTKNKFNAIASLLNEKSEELDKIKAQLIPELKKFEEKEAEKIRPQYRDEALLHFNIENDQTRIKLTEKEIEDLFNNSTINPKEIYDALENIYSSPYTDMSISLFTHNSNGEIKKGITIAYPAGKQNYFFRIKPNCSIKEKTDTTAKVLIWFSNNIKEVRENLLK